MSPDAAERLNRWLQFFGGHPPDEDWDEALKHWEKGKDPPALTIHEYAKKLQQENACDACSGTGKPVSSSPCMCGGSGKMSDAAVRLRERVVGLEEQLAKFRAALERIAAPMDGGLAAIDARRAIAQEALKS